MKTLLFDGWRNRHDGIEEPHKSTLLWVDNDATLQNWMTGKANVTWVSGKPGCGKSTIGKHLLGKMEAQDKATASFFFNDRGAELEKSGNGFLRALVAQILRQIPSLFSHILPEYEVRKAESDSPVSWSAQFLTKTLIAMVHALEDKIIWLVIDAFDECPDGSRDSLLDLVEALATAPSVHILITSRLDPVIIHRMSRHPTIQLDQLLYDDIKIYIKSELEITVSLGERHTNAIEELRRLVLEKSQGVFLWVKLVVIELKHGTMKGRTAQEMREIVDSIPSDLEALFDRLFKRLDAPRGVELRSMLEWIIFAQRPLKLFELRYALAISLSQQEGRDFNSSAEIEESDRVVELSQMERRLRDVGGGLLEVVSVRSQRASKGQTHKRVKIRSPEDSSEEDEGDDKECLVQLIHQSVKEFVLKKYLPDEHSLEPWITKPRSHIRLAQVCITYLSFSDFVGPHHRWDKTFLEYAGMHWMEHATLTGVSKTVRYMEKFTRRGTNHFRDWKAFFDFRAEKCLGLGPLCNMRHHSACLRI